MNENDDDNWVDPFLLDIDAHMDTWKTFIPQETVERAFAQEVRGVERRYAEEYLQRINGLNEGGRNFKVIKLQVIPEH